MREEKLAKAVQQLSGKMGAHIGSGDEAHTPVSTYQAGFMTPEMLKNLQESQGNRTYTGGGRDILTLPAGHYYGLKYKNGPFPETDDSTLTVDITEVKATSGAIARQYLVIKSLTGELFTFTQHYNNTNANSPAVWTEIPRYAKLFSGKAQDVGTEITLMDSVNKYKRLIFELDTNNAGKYDITMSRYVSNGIFNIDFIKKHNNGGIGFRVYDISIQLSGTTGTILSNSTVVQNSTGELASDTSTAKINAIWGITA